MKQYAFGTGTLIGTSAAAGSTPLGFGALQNASVDFSFTTKPLFGQYNFALSVARGQGKIAIKAASAEISGLRYNQLFFDAALAAGMQAFSVGEVHSVPAATPYTVTVTNSATFLDDQGVVYGATGLPLQLVTGTPAQGQYSVSAGVYTFAAADASAPIYITYRYTVAASGQTLTITNQLLGVAPTFALVFSMTYQGAQFNFKLNNCVSNKLTIATKLEDFMMPDFEAEAFADAAGNIGTMSFANVE